MINNENTLLQEQIYAKNTPMYIIILHVNISPKARFDQNLCMKSIAEQMLNRNLKTIFFFWGLPQPFSGILILLIFA